MSDNNYLAPPASASGSPPPNPESTAGGRTRRNSRASQRSQQSTGSRPVSEARSDNVTAAARPEYTSRPSIRIRRVSSLAPVIGQAQQQNEGSSSSSGSGVRRNRSISEPQRPHLAILTEQTPPPSSGNTHLAGVQEETFSPTSGNMHDTIQPSELDGAPAATPNRLRRARTNIGSQSQCQSRDDDEYDARLVDLLDTVGMLHSALALKNRG